MEQLFKFTQFELSTGNDHIFSGRRVADFLISAIGIFSDNDFEEIFPG